MFTRLLPYGNQLRTSETLSYPPQKHELNRECHGFGYATARDGHGEDRVLLRWPSARALAAADGPLDAPVDNLTASADAIARRRQPLPPSPPLPLPPPPLPLLLLLLLLLPLPLLLLLLLLWLWLWLI